jgi:hypothetical protein
MRDFSFQQHRDFSAKLTASGVRLAAAFLRPTNPQSKRD